VYLKNDFTEKPSAFKGFLTQIKPAI